MNFSDLTLTEFTKELASVSAAPGGGSAAALAGALGASLAAMVGRLTIGRKNYTDVSAEFEAIVPRADALKIELLELMQQDADAYAVVMQAYQLAKSTESEQAARTRAIQSALQRAAEIPLRVAQVCAEVLELGAVAGAKGNKNAASDAGVGALMAEAGLQAALLNVEINLGLIHDEEFKACIRVQLGPLKSAAANRQNILNIVQARM
ncbi:MAG: cyclodeaminase/cyclohydrolase family protein [Anaerolineae bacterium]|nr:cyclodeaminase/cyclohydrolase family protein [Anaerolineae bacterium]